MHVPCNVARPHLLPVNQPSHNPGNGSLTVLYVTFTGSGWTGQSIRTDALPIAEIPAVKDFGSERRGKETPRSLMEGSRDAGL
jgi:hypothetical protein